MKYALFRAHCTWSLVYPIKLSAVAIVGCFPPPTCNGDITYTQYFHFHSSSGPPGAGASRLPHVPRVLLVSLCQLETQISYGRLQRSVNEILLLLLNKETPPTPSCINYSLIKKLVLWDRGRKTRSKLDLNRLRNLHEKGGKKGTLK